MADYYLIKDEGGKVTANRVRKDRAGHWQKFGHVPLVDLPIKEIQLAIEMQKLVVRHMETK